MVATATPSPLKALVVAGRVPLPRRPYRPARSRGEWALRSGLALLATLGAYATLGHSLAAVVERADPARAHRLAPSDGRFTAALAADRLRRDQTAASQPETGRLARLALRQDPTAVRAAATLGLQAQLRGDTAGARRLFGYAQSLSRRNLETQLWALEEAVGRGEIPDALRHYDIALRTSRSAPDLLFPVLASAIAEPAVRAGLVPILVRRPIWRDAFIDHAANRGADPVAVADLFAALRRAGTPVPAEATRAAISRLMQAGRFEAAWRYYQSIAPHALRAASRDPEFRADLDPPTAFDWTLATESGVTALIQRGGVFEFAVSPGMGGTVLEQVQMLPPGRYRIEGRSRGIEQPDRSLPYWSLSCWTGRELGRVSVPASARGGGFVGLVSVPADCPVQRLTLVARPSDEIAGSTGQISRARLAPLP